MAAALALAAGLSAASAQQASPGSNPGIDCTCRYKGQDYRLGQMVCLRSPAGPQMARCGMVLNNTSWQFTGRFCAVSLQNAPSGLQRGGAAVISWLGPDGPSPAPPLSPRRGLVAPAP